MNETTQPDLPWRAAERSGDAALGDLRVFPALESGVAGRCAPSATALQRLGASSRKLLAAPFLFLIALYQRVLSPVLHAVAGPAFGCRFYPSCSHYAAEALRSHGVLRGLALAAWRLLRCTPLSAGGLDPVPPPCQRHPRPRCERVA